MIALSHISAYLFWRAYDGHNFAIAQLVDQKHRSPIEEAREIVRFASENHLLDENGKAHVTITPKATPPRHPGIVAHSFAENAAWPFYEVDGIAISSPEFTFLQMASQLNKIPLSAAGSELCSLYAISDGIMKRRRTITSQQRIRRFLENSPRVGCIAQAENAAALIVDNARSPMEWKACMLLSFSHLNGGDNLPKPRLNCRIPLKKPLRSIDELGYPKIINSLECDMVWKGNRIVVVEYQGKAWHSTSSAVERDAAKNNKLAEQGICLLVLTAETVNDKLSFDDFCAILGRQLNCRRRVRTSKAEARNRQLRRSILPNNWLEIAIRERENRRDGR